MFTKILVAIDGSPASEKALAAAVDLAANYRAELTALGVVEVPEVVGMIDEVDEIRQGTEAYLRQINEAAVNYAAQPGSGAAIGPGAGARGRGDCQVRRERGSKPDRRGPARAFADCTVLAGQHQRPG